MHTFIDGEGEQETRFHYNSDLSGDVIIHREEDTLYVPGAHLLAFLAEYLRGERIRALEQTTPAEILGIAALPE